jgi:hypothetical protein
VFRVDGRQPFRYTPERTTTGKVRIARDSATARYGKRLCLHSIASTTPACGQEVCNCAFMAALAFTASRSSLLAFPSESKGRAKSKPTAVGPWR